MNYPIWDTGVVGGGTVIALIAVLHVYIAHLAVGGGLFIWWLDRKALRSGDPGLEGFLARYKGLFLLVTAVLGAVTGVGIWLSISVVNPAGTSVLIHTFVFGWAIEWVFFAGEVVALAIYHYKFHTMDRVLRARVAFFYFLFAWLSLVVIDGILSFMLTPGRWLETGSFWHGFLNPGFLPSMLFRSFLAILYAGLFGVFVATFETEPALRQRVRGTSATWALLGAAGLVPTGLWYHASTPADVLAASLLQNPETSPVLLVFLVGAGLTVVLAVLVRLPLPARLQRALAILMVLSGLGITAGFEYLREFARRPYIIQDHLYTNGIFARDVTALNESGLLAAARWLPPGLREGGDERAQGEALFRIQCSACHTVGGRNDILKASAHLTFLGLQSSLAGQGKLAGYMPPFVGTADERAALAAHVVGTLRGEALEREPAAVTPAPRAFTPPAPVPVEEGEDTYVLLAWNDLGMHCMTDADAWFSLLPPANTLEAQLVRRGDPPELVTEGVTLRYQAYPGVTPTGLVGPMSPPGEDGVWAARAIPVTPYPSDGGYDPFPLFTIEAVASEGDAVLARTAVVAPVSTEMGCRNCHGGPWRHPEGAGLSDETAREILRLHDARSGTTLLAEAAAGRPRRCQDCHADPALAAEGDPARLNLSAAMHGWHANFALTEDGGACALCHPAHPKGSTRCLRDLHVGVGLDCASCHGSLHEHALSLLHAERDAGKTGAARLAAALAPRAGLDADEVKPRQPWLQQPDCLSCHEDFAQPEAGASAFNRWVAGAEDLYRMRTDEAGLRCAACHGAPHALYPSPNPLAPGIDTIQPVQYTGAPLPLGAEGSCTACHEEAPDESIHHENMDGSWRRKDLLPPKP